MATDSVWKWAFLLALLLVVVGVALLRHRSGCPFRIGQVLGSALIFGLLGPPLGGLMLGLGVLVIESGSRGIGLLLFLMLASYLLGLVPAVAETKGTEVINQRKRGQVWERKNRVRFISARRAQRAVDRPGRRARHARGRLRGADAGDIRETAGGRHAVPVDATPVH